VAMVDLPGLIRWIKKTLYRLTPVPNTLVCEDRFAEFVSV
jgi:hypothetical protein